MGLCWTSSTVTVSLTTTAHECGSMWIWEVQLALSCACMGVQGKSKTGDGMRDTHPLGIVHILPLQTYIMSEGSDSCIEIIGPLLKNHQLYFTDF